MLCESDSKKLPLCCIYSTSTQILAVVWIPNYKNDIDLWAQDRCFQPCLQLRGQFTDLCELYKILDIKWKGTISSSQKEEWWNKFRKRLKDSNSLSWVEFPYLEMLTHQRWLFLGRNWESCSSELKGYRLTIFIEIWIVTLLFFDQREPSKKDASFLCNLQTILLKKKQNKTDVSNRCQIHCIFPSLIAE